MKRFAIIALPLLAAACAQSPGSIKPVNMGNAFAAVDCTTAAAEHRQEKAVLADLEDKQRGAAMGDAIGVLLLGVPTASLTGGDKAGDISASKGKLLALEARLASCGA